MVGSWNKTALKLFLALERRTDAITALSNLARLEPVDGSHAYGPARRFELTDNKDTAADAYRQALALNPDNPVHAHLARWNRIQ